MTRKWINSSRHWSTFRWISLQMAQSSIPLVFPSFFLVPTCRVGDPAVSVPLTKLDGSETSLSHYLDLASNSGMPLVVFAGSWTWPPFRQQVDEVHALYVRISLPLLLFILRRISKIMLSSLPSTWGKLTLKMLWFFHEEFSYSPLGVADWTTCSCWFPHEHRGENCCLERICFLQ